MNDRYFQRLVKEGVQSAQPTHYAQVVVYLEEASLTRSLYICQNKNDDTLYQARIEPNPRLADRLIKKAKTIIFSAYPLDRISDDPSWFECKFCDYWGLCHNDTPPRMSCRTCTHSRPVIDDTPVTEWKFEKRTFYNENSPPWVCNIGDERYRIPLSVQRTGCELHLFIPDLLTNVCGVLQRYDDEYVIPTWVEYTGPNGKLYINRIGGKINENT